MVTTRETGALVPVEVKPEESSAADRGVAVLADHIATVRLWGGCRQAALTGILADLIVLSEEDPDLDFADALSAAWHRVDVDTGRVGW